MIKLYKIIFLLILINCGNTLTAKNSIFINKKEFPNSVTKKNVILPTATISGTTIVCQNATNPKITFKITDGVGPYKFVYQINDETKQTIESASNIVTVDVLTENPGVFTYKFISFSEASGDQTLNDVTATVTIKTSPDGTLGGTGSGSNFNGVPVFRICSNTISSFTFTNASNTPTLNTNYTINWGDGSPDFNSSSWLSTTHTYSIGLWNLTYIIQGNNGCNTIAKYIVFVGSNPAVSLGNPGNTDICNSSSLIFPITGTTNNPPGTTYTVSFNDGSAPQTFNHPPPASITHTFLKTSCGTNSVSGSGTTYSNSFSANIKAENPCGASEVGVVPIYVSTPPTANFTLPTKSCINTQVCMTNTSTGAYENNGNNCNTSPKIIWSISPSTGFSVVSGSLGNDFNSTDPALWLSGSNAPCLNFSQSGTYTITIKTGNRCGFDTVFKTICVEPKLTPTFTLDNTSGCSSKTITATNTTDTTNSCSPLSYLWSVNYSPTINCGTNIPPITSQTTTDASFTFTESGTYTIKLTATNSCLPATTSTQTVIIKKPPTVTINPIVNICPVLPTNTISPKAVITNCGTQSPLTYEWSFPGGTPSSSNLEIPGDITYSSTGTFTYSLKVTNECGPSTASGSFTINPTPVISGDLFSCAGSKSQLTGSPTAATTLLWVSSSPNIATVSNSGLVTGLLAGTTNITYTNTFGCKTTVSFIVNQAPVITSQPTPATACQGGIVPALSFTTSGINGTAAYQWYSNTSNNTLGTAIPGETTATYNPPSATAGIFYYYCIITLPTGGCNAITTTPVKVTILTNISITTQPTDSQNLCIGGTIATPLTITTSGGTGNYSYQWYSNTTNSNTGGTLITGAASIKFTPDVFTIPGTYYYYATVSPNGNGCIPITSNTAVIIVYPDPTITTQPVATQTLCQNTTSTNLEVNAIGGNVAFSYQWYSNSSNVNTGGTIIFGATNNTYTPPSNIVGTKYYYSVASQNSTSGCNVTSATSQVIVIATPTINNHPVSSAICLGGTPTILSVSYINGVGLPGYQWFSNVNTSNSGGVLIPGETNSTFNPPNTTAGTFYYYCIITLSSGGCSNITSNTATVIINTLPSIDLQPISTQTLCVGAALSTPLKIHYTGGEGNPTYKWYTNSSNSNIGGILISGATNASYLPPVFTLTGNYYYYAEVSLNGNGCGTLLSNPAEIAIIPDPVITSQPLPSQTLCQNALATDLTVSASGGIGTTYSYQWFSNTLNNNTTGTPISGATLDSYLPPTSSNGTYYYYCVISQSTGSGCNVTSNTATVIVNLAPSFTSQPISNTICIGQTLNALSVSYINGVGTAQYQWYSNGTNTIIGGTSISGAVNSSYNAPNSVVGTFYYYCIITLPSGGCSSLTSNIANVTINQKPVIANKTAQICSGDAFTILPNNSGSDIVPLETTYTWALPTISPSSSITGTSAQNTQQNAISQRLINTTTGPATVTYVVTPISGNCTGTSFTVVITVNPAITLNDTKSNSTCFGINNGSIQVAISGGVPFSSGDSYQIDWSGPNGFTSNISNIANLAPGDYTISVRDQQNCSTTKKYTIIEPNEIVISSILEKDITCFNDADGKITIAITGGSPTYIINWTKNGIPFSNIQNLSNLGPGTYTVTVSDIYNCGPKTALFTITEPPLLAVSLAGKTDVLCNGDATGAITINNTGGTLPYTYAWKGPNGFSSTNQNLTHLIAGTYNLIITDHSGCTQNLTETITQNSAIIITATSTPIICYNDNNASINIAISGGIGPYQISWSNLGNGTFMDNLSAGDYLVTVTDALNCVKTLNVNIPEAPIFTIRPVVKNISCFGAKNGSIKLNLIGGIAPIKLTWSDNSSSGTERNNLAPGTYAVTIVDAKPCTITKTFIIIEPQLLALSANVTNAFDCNNAKSGSINLLVSGGTPPFTYNWSNGATSEDLTNLSSGNYLVTVTDFNGCSEQAQYNINRPPAIVTKVDTKTDFDCETKYVKQTFAANVTGGMPPYQLDWSSGKVSGANNEIMNTSQNGTVILNVTDNLGCKSNYTFNVDIPILGDPSFDTTSFALTTYGIYSVNDPIVFTNTSTGSYISSYWDFGDGAASNEINPTHTFVKEGTYLITQTVTYPFGCIYKYTSSLKIEKGYDLITPNGFTPNGDGINDTFKPTFKGFKTVDLSVYDTWGELIYSEKGNNLRGWDGKIKGTESENGNYYFKISGVTFYGTTINTNGPFTLIK
ncbi:PKD domain-containing protein [Flavobacterium sp. AC]|uniref:PKD domain-containing protein n=1 Tax=Flavobacterium azizsancarii TaxID=2961580 RepID=A0ABT4WGX5_9FLAO|nr:PKD domain-containing protein [Flavobacterium azizsancarii]MDA6071834.1 PKD domain-containing protein [Flavobacterium azizsancarii]